MKKKIRKIKTLHRKKDQRKALLRELANSLFQYDEIKTTEVKAKELRKFAEKLITKGKKNNVAAKRYLAQYITNKTIFKKFFDEIVPRYESRPGGYTKIYKLKPRESDGARMVIISLIK